MNNIEKLMKLPGNTIPCTTQGKGCCSLCSNQVPEGWVEKTSTKIAVADGTGYITANCYDSVKMSMLKLDNSLVLRNYIKKADNTIVINRPTVVSLTSAVTVSEMTKAESKRHIDDLPEAVKIIDAVKEGTTSTIMGKVTKKLTTDGSFEIEGIDESLVTIEVETENQNEFKCNVWQFSSNYKKT